MTGATVIFITNVGEMQCEASSAGITGTMTARLSAAV